MRGELNPGIVATVEWLRSHGFTTCDSGDGETHDFECDLPIPYVHMEVAPNAIASEALRLRALLESLGVRISEGSEDGTTPSIAATYDPANNVAIVSLFNVRLDGQTPESAATQKPGQD